MFSKTNLLENMDLRREELGFNWNVIKSTSVLKIKIHIKIQEIGPDYLGLVYLINWLTELPNR